MTLAITSSTFPSDAASFALAAVVAKPQPVTNNPVANNDSVRLTEAEQAQQLYWHGQTVPEIAFGMNLSVQAVNEYLNISNSK